MLTENLRYLSIKYFALCTFLKEACFGINNTWPNQFLR